MEKPLLLKKPIRLALVNGATQFREVVKDYCLQHIDFATICPIMNKPPFCKNGRWHYELQSAVDDAELYDIKPRFQVGDELWMKEPYIVMQAWHSPNDINDLVFEGEYLDDKKYLQAKITTQEAEAFYAREYFKEGHNIRAAWMYKSLARHWFKVKAVRCGLLQDMKWPEDDVASGCKNVICDNYPHQFFIKDWNATHKPSEQWDKNPHCFIYTIKKIK